MITHKLKYYKKYLYINESIWYKTLELVQSSVVKREIEFC